MFVIHHYVVNTVNVFLSGGDCGRMYEPWSSPRLSLLLLKSAAYFCTVDKAGASSPNVTTCQHESPSGLTLFFADI